MQHFIKKILVFSLIASLCVVNIALAQTAPTDQTAVTDPSQSAPTDSTDTASVTPPADDSSQTPADDSSTSVAPVDTAAPADSPADAPADTVDSTDTSTDATDASSTPPADTQPADTSSDASSSPDLQGSTATVQDTTNTQPAASADVLEDTTNPNTASSTGDDIVIPLIDATSTASTTDATDPLPLLQATSTDDTLTLDQSTSSLDVVSDSIDSDASSTTQTDTQADVVQTLPQTPPPAPLPIKNEPPKPEYQFALTGKTMSAKKEIKNANGDVVGEQDVAVTLTPQVNNTTGTVSVSGQCSDTYFVVLLYKNPDDYANDPRSYVLNTAYPCVGGSFTYAISSLPANLADGTYYLLVGQEGDTGTWTPVTGLTEISINRNQ